MDYIPQTLTLVNAMDSVTQTLTKQMDLNSQVRQLKNGIEMGTQ